IHDLELLFQRSRGAGFVAAVIGLHASAVEGNFSQTNQPDTHRNLTDLSKQPLQRLGKPRAEFGQGRMVGPPPAEQPDKVNTIGASFFQLAAGADATTQSI